ncbi:MAG: hypothetical protein H7259_10115 [Cytophagales bacterium]|nr:hypothetical protein [Cytophaga sp.]
MNHSKALKVIVMEDDRNNINTIAKELSNENYRLHFFSKDNSIFDLLEFNPDILIQDYFKNKVINCHEWAVPY